MNTLEAIRTPWSLALLMYLKSLQKASEYPLLVLVSTSVVAHFAEAITLVLNPQAEDSTLVDAGHSHSSQISALSLGRRQPVQDSPHLLMYSGHSRYPLATCQGMSSETAD